MGLIKTSKIIDIHAFFIFDYTLSDAMQFTKKGMKAGTGKNCSSF
jgi:hypothetical protein